ncbi:MAG TPA: hypothetical protein ENG33_09680, partial [Chloroflexi bacterium]|nr:hypothetical protein [Chloroflexota bacterium]
MTEARRVESPVVEPAELTYPTGFSRKLPLPHLPLRISERKLLLAFLDLMALSLALLVVLKLRFGYAFSPSTTLAHPGWFVLLFALWLPIALAFDAYELRTASSWSSSAKTVLKAGGISLTLYLLIPRITPHLVHSRLTIFLFLVTGLAFLTAGRLAYSLALAQPAFRRRVLIVGAGWAGRTILNAIQKHGNGLYQVIGFVDDDPAKLGKGVWEQRDERTEGQGGRGAEGGAPQHPRTSASLRVLGNRHSIKELVATYGISALVLAITHEVNGELLQILMDCLELGVEVIPMPVLYEQLTGRVPIEHIGDNWYVAMPIQHPGSSALYPLLKRLMDIVLASLGLFLLGLALPVIALAIYLDSPGPIFYTQKRV